MTSPFAVIPLLAVNELVEIVPPLRARPPATLTGPVSVPPLTVRLPPDTESVETVPLDSTPEPAIETGAENVPASVVEPVAEIEPL